MKQRVNALLWIGLTGTLIIGTSFFSDVYRALWGDSSIWWTHQDMRLPIEETRGNFEIYIGEKALQKHLSEKTLFSADSDGKQRVVVSEDIWVRLNNWDKVKSSILANATMSGFGFGVAITLFVIGLVKHFSYGKKKR